MILYKKKLQVDKEDFQLETTELYYFFEVVKMEPKKKQPPGFPDLNPLAEAYGNI